MYAFIAGLMSRIFRNIKPRHQSHIDESLAKNREFILQDIKNICLLMPDDSTSNNWRIHFSKMQASLVSMPNKHGIEKAQRIWENMQGGMGSWSDYYIPHPEQKTMIHLNEELQQHCALLSHNFKCIEQCE